jgi:hypothetical protein
MTTSYTLTATNSQGSVEATVTVTVKEPKTATGKIRVSPYPCTIYHSESSCTVDVRWWSVGPDSVKVKVSVNGGQESLFATSAGGGTSLAPHSMNATIERDSSYKFILYGDSEGTLTELATRVVTATTSIQCPP